MAFLKKRKIPSELPDLIVDKLEELKKLDRGRNLSETEFDIKPIIERIEKPIEEERIEKVFYAPIQTPPVEPLPEKISIEDEKAFFTRLLNDINNELDDGKNIEEWYKNEFFPKDIVTEMKNYWGNQKKELIFKSLGKSFKERIETKIKELKKMEEEWQNIYLNLIKKEENIRKEEEELKKIISEFVGMCNREMENTDSLEDESE